MLSESLTWRKKHAVDRIIAEYQVPQVTTDYFPGGWHHYDKGMISQQSVLKNFKQSKIKVKDFLFIQEDT